MNYRLVIHRLAERDIAEARDWYDAERTGLGDEFVAEIYRLGAKVVSQPYAFPAVRKPFRKALPKNFPYKIYYFLKDRTVTVVAVIHSKRSARVWKNRIKDLE